MRHIYDACVRVVAGGTVAPEYLLTTRNRMHPKVLRGISEVFAAQRAMIASANEEVLIQNFAYHHDSDGAKEISEGLKELQARRQAEHPDGPPVVVRFLINQGRLTHPHSKRDLDRELDRLGLDPRFVKVETAAHVHHLFGVLHSKVVVVDRRKALMSGANLERFFSEPTEATGPSSRLAAVAQALRSPSTGEDGRAHGRLRAARQALFPQGSGWFDAGYVFEGEIAEGLSSEFGGSWELKSGEPLPPLATAPDHQTEGAGVPILLVTRPANGNVFGGDVHNPQDQAFLAAFRHAKKQIRIVTPNLNDASVKRALLEALMRGVEVQLVLSKGFNDGTERFAGGTNEQVIAELRRELIASGHGDKGHLLDARWYIAEGGDAPVEGRDDFASHAKYCSVDGQVVFVGSANMDGQAWLHSRETNAVVDSAEHAQRCDHELFEPLFERAAPI